MDNHSGVFSSAGSNGYFISLLEKLIVDNSLMDLILEGSKEAFLANGLQILWPFNEGFLLITDSTDKLRHSLANL